MTKIGFIGLGIMGKPMARNLIKNGYSLVVNDVNESAQNELMQIGAEVGTYREIGMQCDVIFTSLPNGEIVQHVLIGPDGVLQTVHPGSLVCDTSSVTPGEARSCAAAFAEKGVDYIDAPVSGGEPGAVNGTLAFMAGGTQKAFDRVLPYLRAMGKSFTLVGPSGCGCVIKLANQIIVNVGIATVSEALVLAVKSGADPEKVYQAIRGGLAGSAVLDAKAPMMIERNFKPGGKISINHKDIKNVLASAHEVDSPVPFSAQLFEILQALKAHGHMDDDHAGIVQYFEALADCRVESRENTQ